MFDSTAAAANGCKTGFRGQQLYDNNDPGVHDDDDNDTVLFRDNLQDHHLWTADNGLTSVIGGGGSLLQFESLEKQCAEQTVFRTTATAAPFMTNSAESLNRLTGNASRGRHGWKYQQQQLAADDDNAAAVADDDEAMLCSTPFSSYAGDGSSIKSLSKSMESVHSAASRKRCNRDDVSQSLEDLRRRGRDDGQHDATAEPATSGGMYKTVDCLIDPAYRKPDETDGGDKPLMEEDPAVAVTSTAGCKQQHQQRSAENLSEDSGFGDQVPAVVRCGSAVVQTYKPIAEDENYFEMSTKSIASIAAAGVVPAVTAHCSNTSGKGTYDDDDEVKSKFSAAWHSYTDLGDRRPSVTPTTSPTTDEDDDDNCHHHHHRQQQLHDGMASRLPMSSTPNLCADGLLLADADGDYIRTKKLLLDSTVSLDRSHSLKRIHYESESALSAASSRGSNLLITTSFVSLAAAPTPNKGVHFCPVVSEVNWRESFSSSSSCVDDDRENESEELPETEDDDDRHSSDEVDENIDTMVMKLLTSLPSENKRRPSVAEKQQLRERLDFITGGSPPVSHRIVAAPTRTTATGFTVPPVSVQSRPGLVEAPAVVTMPKSKSIGGKLGGFFQRFSLRRLSGRRNKDKKKQKTDGADIPSAAVATTTAAPNNNYSRPDTPPPPPPVSGRPSAAAVADDRGKKPPLPPQPPSDGGYSTRRRLVYDENRGGRLPPPALPPTAGSRASLLSRSPATAMSRPDHRAGLLETDLDSNVTRTSSSSLMMGGGGCSPNKKTRSLLDLGASSSAKLSLAPSDSSRPSNDGSSSNATDYRAKSMEFLLDKENQAAVQVKKKQILSIVNYYLGAQAFFSSTSFIVPRARCI